MILNCSCQFRDIGPILEGGLFGLKLAIKATRVFPNHWATAKAFLVQLMANRFIKKPLVHSRLVLVVRFWSVTNFILWDLAAPKQVPRHYYYLLLEVYSCTHDIWEGVELQRSLKPSTNIFFACNFVETCHLVLSPSSDKFGNDTLRNPWELHIDQLPINDLHTFNPHLL